MTFIFWKSVFRFYPKRTHILQGIPRKFRFIREGSSDIKILKNTELYVKQNTHHSLCVFVFTLHWSHSDVAQIRIDLRSPLYG